MPGPYPTTETSALTHPQPGTRQVLPFTSSSPLCSLLDTIGDMRSASKACGRVCASVSAGSSLSLPPACARGFRRLDADFRLDGAVWCCLTQPHLSWLQSLPDALPAAGLQPSMKLLMLL